MNDSNTQTNQHHYQIFVSGLKISIRLGCNPQERLHFQSAQIDLVFEVVSSSVAEDIAQTVCYLTASNLARTHAVSKEWILIENFLESLTGEFFQRFNTISQVEARLTKFVVPGCEGAGVKIVRRRIEGAARCR